MKRYHHVYVTEGGADFTDYVSPDDVPVEVNRWHTKADRERVLAELRAAEIGDEIVIDGCSVCFVLKPR